MAIEDNIDELYALHVAGAILCMRMWSYVTTAAAKAGGTSEKDFVDRQRKMAIESVNLWNFEGHDNPEHLRTSPPLFDPLRCRRQKCRCTRVIGGERVAAVARAT